MQNMCSCHSPFIPPTVHSTRAVEGIWKQREENVKDTTIVAFRAIAAALEINLTEIVPIVRREKSE